MAGANFLNPSLDFIFDFFIVLLPLIGCVVDSMSGVIAAISSPNLFVPNSWH